MLRCVGLEGLNLELNGFVEGFDGEQSGIKNGNPDGVNILRDNFVLRFFEMKIQDDDFSSENFDKVVKMCERKVSGVPASILEFLNEVNLKRF